MNALIQNKNWKKIKNHPTKSKRNSSLLHRCNGIIKSITFSYLVWQKMEIVRLDFLFLKNIVWVLKIFFFFNNDIENYNYYNYDKLVHVAVGFVEER